MKLQNMLGWLMKGVLPLAHWRVPVALLRGHDRVTGREVVVLRAGGKVGTHHILSRLFAQAPAVERETHAPVWRLQRLLNDWRGAADLTLIGIDRVSARLFLDPHYLAQPQWINSGLTVPADMKVFTNKHKSIQADLRRFRIKKFECHYSREDKDFDLFYEKFHRPYLQARHGDTSMVAPRWILRYVFKQGMIQWVCLGGERVGGGIVTVKGTRYTKMVNGVLDGRMDLLKEGVLSAMYVHSITEARGLGCTEMNLGGSLPSLHDGVFRYKSKWASKLSQHDGYASSNIVTLLSWERLAGPVADFLSHTSLIHHDQDDYSALWAYPTDEPLTAVGLNKHYQFLKAAGLRRFYILLPGDPPADFKCPAEVCLIPIAEVNEGGPAKLHTYF